MTDARSEDLPGEILQFVHALETQFSPLLVSYDRPRNHPGALYVLLEFEERQVWFWRPRPGVLHLVNWNDPAEQAVDCVGVAEATALVAEWFAQPARYTSAPRTAAVKADGLTFIGCTGEMTLEKLGIKVDKKLGPQFGIVFG